LGGGLGVVGKIKKKKRDRTIGLLEGLLKRDKEGANRREPCSTSHLRAKSIS